MRSILEVLREKLTGVADRVLLWWRQRSGSSGARRAPHAPPDDARIAEPPTPPAGAAAGADTSSREPPAESSTQDARAGGPGGLRSEVPASDRAAATSSALTAEGASPAPADETGGQEEPGQAQATGDASAHVISEQPVLLDQQVVAGTLPDAIPAATVSALDATHRLLSRDLSEVEGDKDGAAAPAWPLTFDSESAERQQAAERQFLSSIFHGETPQPGVQAEEPHERIDIASESVFGVDGPQQHATAAGTPAPSAAPAQADERSEPARSPFSAEHPAAAADASQQEPARMDGAIDLREEGTQRDAQTIEPRTTSSNADAELADGEKCASVAQDNGDSVAAPPHSDDEASARVEAGAEPEESANGLTAENLAARAAPSGEVAKPAAGAACERAADVGLPEPSRRSDARAERISKRVQARARHDEADRPLVISAPPLREPDYQLWNRAIAQHRLLEEGSEEDAFLTITPTILAAALAGVQPGRQLPEDAEARFVEAVAEVYRGRVLGHQRRLGVLRRCGADGLPECVAFLAASVLAAYRMQTDEEATATAYYLRLSEILKCDLIGGHPRGFDPDEFEALWRFLERWLREEKGRRLAMPGPDVGLRRFVALPLTHVPLRCVDIERLPEFFAWSGYEPVARIPRQKLDLDLSSWSLGRSVFTNAGMSALADDRRAAVLAQIAHELESWDGSHTDSLGRRSGRVEVLLDIVQRRPELYYLPRRPPAFPSVFDDGMHAFEASDEGWYDPVRLRPEDGGDLAEGFAWEVRAGSLRLVLRRPGASAIAMPAHEYTGFLSHRALRLGAPGAALCREALADAAAEYLSAISGQRCVPLNHPDVPEGWRLFTAIKPARRLDAPPSGLEALVVESAIDLIPAGGLRLGSRWAWVSGAPPRLMVAGLLPGSLVTIDGDPVNVPDDGVLVADGHLAVSGTHVVEAAGLRRRIEIVEPEVRNASRPSTLAGSAVALPPGHWTLIGSSPGELAYPVCRSRGGAVAFCTFTAVWAVDVGAGPGATALCLQANVPAPRRIERFAPYGPVGRSLVAWASTIYNAAIRRPRLISLSGDEPGPEMREGWAAFSRSARDIKRRFRNARR